MKNKTLRQILALVLVVMMLVPNFAVPTIAEGETDITWTVGNASVTKGEATTVTLPVTLANTPDYEGGTLEFEYDTSVLKLTAIEKGSGYPDDMTTFTPNPAGNKVVYFGLLDYSVANGTEMFLITFEIIDAEAEGDYSVMAVASEHFSVDVDFTCVSVPGTINISSGAPDVAMIGSTGYKTVQAAVAAAAAGDTISLINDVTLPCTTGNTAYKNPDLDNERIVIPADKNITLDLNSHKIIGGAYSDGVIRNYGSLTINATTGGIEAHCQRWGLEDTDIDCAIGNYNGGVLVINGGVFDHGTIKNYAGGNITVNDGTFGDFSTSYYSDSNTNETDTDAGMAKVNATGTTINGGTFTNSSAYSPVEINAGTFTMTGGKINGAVSLVNYVRGVDISDGEVVYDFSSDSKAALYISNNKDNTNYDITISGGSFISNNNSPAIKWGNGNLNITGGHFASVGNTDYSYVLDVLSGATTFARALNITGGEFVNNGTGYVTAASNANTNGMSYTIGGDAKLSAVSGAVIRALNPGQKAYSYTLTGGRYKPAEGMHIVDYINAGNGEKVNDYVADGCYVVAAADGWYNVVAQDDESVVATLSSNGITYASIYDALANAQATDTITLLKDQTGLSQGIIIPQGKNITLNLGTNRLSGSCYTDGYTANNWLVQVEGTLTVNATTDPDDLDEGGGGMDGIDADGYADYLFAVRYGGKLVLNGGSYNNGYAYPSYGSDITLNDTYLNMTEFTYNSSYKVYPDDPQDASAQSNTKLTVNNTMLIAIRDFWLAGDVVISGSSNIVGPATYYLGEGTFELKDEAAIDTWLQFRVTGSGKAVISGGSVTNYDSYNAVEVNSQCTNFTLDISGGTFTNKSSGSPVLNVENGTVNITGGTFVNEETGDVVQLRADGTLNIGGSAKLSATNGSAIDAYSGTIKSLALTGGSYMPSEGKFVVSLGGAEKAQNYIPAGFALSAADAEGWQTIKTTFDVSLALSKAEYNAGEQVEAIIYAAPVGGMIKSYNFNLVFDSTKLRLESVTSSLGAEVEANNDGSYACVIDGNGIKIDSENFAIAKATFTALTPETCSNVTIGINNLAIGTPGSADDAAVGAVADKTVKIHNDRIVVNGSEHIALVGGNQTLYAKHGVAGLYTDSTYTTPVTDISFTAQEGYMAKSGANWVDNNNNTYASFADVIAAGAGCTTVTYTVNEVKMPVVSFAQAENGTLSSTASMFVEPGTVINASWITGNGIIATADENYVFAGWTVNGAALTGNFTVDADVTIAPVFAAATFSFTADSTDKYTVSNITGLNADGKAVYGQDVSFKLEATGNNTINSVYYTVGTDTTKHVANGENGVYTIPGTAITGDITVGAEVSTYVTVTFKAGTGVTGSDVVLYAMYGSGTLYTDKDCTQAASAPVFTAQEGYRLPADTEIEPMYTAADGAKLTFAMFANQSFTNDAIFTVNAIKTYVVTVAKVGEGTVAPASVTVDAGTNKSAVEAMITATPATGYEPAVWSWSIEGDTVAADATLTATFAIKTFTIAAPDANAAYTMTVTGATQNPDGSYTVKYGDQITITVTAKGDNAIETVKVINGTDEVTGTDGSFTFTVAGTPNVQVTTYETVTVTVVAGANGTVTPQTLTVKKGTAKADVIAQVTATANNGYEFSGWTWSVEGDTLTTAATLTANFTEKTFTVNVNGESAGNVKFGGSFTLDKIAILNDDGTFKVITKIGSIEGADFTVDDETGNYVISNVTGNVNVTVTYTMGKLLFISGAQYQAAPAYSQIAVIGTNALTNEKFALNGEGDFFRSDKYDAYVKFVGDYYTAEDLLRNLVIMDGAATAIKYGGDINGNGKVNSVDGGIVSDIIAGRDVQGITDLMRFEMDVFNAASSDAVTMIGTENVQVTTADIQWILNKSVGLN